MSCPIYDGLCDDGFDILNSCDFKFVKAHKGAVNSFLITSVVTNYVAGTSLVPSPGFRVLLRTVCGQKYTLCATAQLTQGTGSEAFIYVESCKNAVRLVPRTNTWTVAGGLQTYNIEFTAIDSATFVGILFKDADVDYSLTTTKFTVDCSGQVGPQGPQGPAGPVDCDIVTDCICAVEECPDEYLYEICTDFLQVHLNLLNSPASFPVGTEIAIRAYHIDGGGIVSVGPQVIGTVPVTFAEVKTAFEALGWTTIDLVGGQFRASLASQTQLFSHVLIDDSMAVGPPFSIGLPTNCSQIDECATTDPNNRLLIKKPDDSLCWANICPQQLDTSLTSCPDTGEDHVAILPDETLSDEASISIGPKIGVNTTGFISAEKPLPGSTTGGDCRGGLAVDWQMSRTDPNQVAGADRSFIGGGSSNRVGEDDAGADAQHSSVVGGSGNWVVAEMNTGVARWSVIGGGQNNRISAKLVGSVADHSGILSGTGNQIYAYSSVAGAVIGGGTSNRVLGESTNAVVSGGSGNTVDGSTRGAVLSGTGNDVTGSTNGVVVGGSGNSVSGSATNAVVGGGSGNTASGTGSVVGGGSGNTASGTNSTVGSGSGNTASGTNSGVVAGSGNTASSGNSVVGGGSGNDVTGTSTGGVISGGAGNSVTDSLYGQVSGGSANTVAGTTRGAVLSGTGNSVTGASTGSVVIGGNGNSVTGGSVNSIVGGGSGINIDDSDNTVVMGGSGTQINVSGATTNNGIFMGGGISNIVTADDNNIQGTVLVGGESNRIEAGATGSANHSVIVGGLQNRIAFDKLSFIGGGYQNQIIVGPGGGPSYNVVVGGRTNKVEGYGAELTDASVVGGFNNTITGYTNSSRGSFIGGGLNNAIIDSSSCFIGGGGSDNAGESFINRSSYCNIVGGKAQQIDGGGVDNNNLIYSGISHGESNQITTGGSGTCSHVVIGGGKGNIIRSNGSNSIVRYSSIEGGYNNNITVTAGASNCLGSAIVGGYNNKITLSAGLGVSVNYCTIGGGFDNEIINTGANNRQINNSSILSGTLNEINADTEDINNCVIGGGTSNTIRTISPPINNSGIFTGNTNIIYSSYSALLTGSNNTISKNADNSVILGGSNNVISDNHVRCLIFGNNITTSASNQIVIPAIDSTIASDYTNVVVADGNGSEPQGTLGKNPSSSQRYKEQIVSLGEQTNVVDKLHDLNPVSFVYKADTKKSTRYGLIAEQVNEVFPDLVPKNKDGQPESVKYRQFIGLILAELQRTKKELDAMKARLDALESA